MNGYNAEAVVVAHVAGQRVRNANARTQAVAKTRDELAALVLELSAKVQKQNDEISKLRGQVMGDAMHIAGIEAARDAYMEQHVDSPLLRDTGERFKKSGNVKTFARKIYEKAYDVAGRKLGITNPVAYRQD